MLITIENKYGETLSQIFASKKKMISTYADFNKNIFGVEVDEQSLLDTTLCGVTNMNNHFIGLLNKSLKEKSSGIRLTSLEKDLKEQIIEHFVSKFKEETMNILEDNMEFLCSESKLSEEEIKDIYMKEVFKGIEKDYKAEDIVSCHINNLLKVEELYNQEINNQSIEFADIIENEKSSTPKETVKGSDNFVNPTVAQEAVDVDYKEVILSEDDKKELKNKIEECTNFYCNKDRLLVMLGGNISQLSNVFNNVIDIINDMDKIILESKNESKESIMNKLSEKQLEISSMINSYNANIDTRGRIIDTFKATQVDGMGQPIKVEDFFGREYDTEELNRINNIIDPIEEQNKELFDKYEELYNIVTPIQQQTGTTIKLEEVKSSYKYMNPVIKASVMIKDTEVNRYFYIDLNGTLYNDSNKFIILNDSDILDDGYYIDSQRIDLITKYIFGTLSEKELKKNDMISEELRILNKIVDLSSVHSSNKKLISEILLEVESKKLLNEAVADDADCRFRLDKITKETFEMISDSKTKKYFNGPSCKRKKKLKLSYNINNKELILDGGSK